MARWTLYGHVDPEFPPLVVAMRRAEVPWLTPDDVRQLQESTGKDRLWLRLRDNRAGEVYPDAAWSDEIA